MTKNTKYKDKHTLIGWQKELDKEDFSESVRERRRKNNKEIKKFCLKMSLYDKDWWDCISESDKNSIWRDWTWNSGKYIPKFIKKVKKIYKIDQSLYRDKKISRLLNE